VKCPNLKNLSSSSSLLRSTGTYRPLFISIPAACRNCRVLSAHPHTARDSHGQLANWQCSASLEVARNARWCQLWLLPT
jgi:hypothetical protein